MLTVLAVLAVLAVLTVLAIFTTRTAALRNTCLDMRAVTAL